MASKSRFLQTVFGLLSGSTETGTIGSDSAGSPAYTKDIGVMQSLSQYGLGLFAITGNAAEPPRIQDFNSLFYMLTWQLSYCFQSGIPEWLSTENYYASKSIVQRSGSIYIAYTGTDETPNLNNDPATTSAPATTINWVKLVDVGGSLAFAAGSIEGLTNKTIPVEADVLLIEDSGASWVKKYTTISALPVFHKDIAGEIDALTQKTSIVDADVSLIEDSAASFAKKMVLESTKKTYYKTPNVYTSITNYTATTTDGYDEVRVPHTSSTGLFTAALANLNTQTNRKIKILNNGNGLTKITGNIKYKDLVLTSFFLYMDGDYVEIESDGTYLKVTRCYSHLKTNFISNSSWAKNGSRKIGLAVTYNSKNAAVDFTGEHITESTSGNTWIVSYDSGGTGSSGILYLYNATGNGIATNARTLTGAYSGKTVTVNETSGSNKNQDYNIWHGQGITSIEYIDCKFYSSIDGTTVKEFLIVFVTAVYVGMAIVYNDANSVFTVTANAAYGFGNVDTSGNVNSWGGNSDYFYNYQLEFKI